GRGADRAADLGQRGVGDLDVQDRHEGAQDATRDGEPVAERQLPLLVHRCAWVAPALGAAACCDGVERVLTVAVTLRPGRSSAVSGSWGSSTIFTGTRCTILVK